MHEGHRARMRKKIMEMGADALEPHELLEVYLYSSISRRNTNDIAHKLIDRFGSLAGVLDADINELMEVDGIGEISAQQIKLLPAIFRAYGLSGREKREKFDTLRAAGEFGIALFRGKTTECVYALLLDNSMRKIDCIKVAEGPLNSVSLDMRLLYKEILNKNVSAVILYHNHYGGLSIPSGTDISTTHQLEQELYKINAVLIEHIVVADNNFSPILSMQKGKLRYFSPGGSINSHTMDKFYDT